MARQTGNIKITGTIDNFCFYKMNGDFYARTKSSLTAKKVKTSPLFQLTRVYAGLMGQASKIASSIYKELPKDFRQFWMYRAFTGEALQLLKAGKTIEQTTQLLWRTYVAVWEQKKAVNQPPRPVKTSSPVHNNRPVKSKISFPKIFNTLRYNVQLPKTRKQGKRKIRTRWRNNKRSEANRETKHSPRLQANIKTLILPYGQHTDPQDHYFKTIS